MQKPTHRQLIIAAVTVAVVLGAIALFAIYHFRDSIPPIAEIRERTVAYLQSIPAPLYFLAFAILPSFGVPLSLFYLTTIPVMGFLHPALAAGIGLMAVAFNMALTNVLGRTILHPAIEWVIRHRHLKIPKLKRESEWKVVLATRLSPVPFALQNYLLALGHARWRFFLGMSMLIQGTIGTAVMLLGESILTGGLGYILLALFVLLVLHLILDNIRKRLTQDAPSSDE